MSKYYKREEEGGENGLPVHLKSGLNPQKIATVMTKTFTQI